MIHADPNFDITKIPEDEPVFLLRGRDALAYATIACWVQTARALCVNEDKIRLVEAHMEKIRAYQPKKLPD